MDRSEARSELWRRYDAGEVEAHEVEERLRRLDRVADGDEAGLRSALDAPIPVHRRRATKRTALVAAVALALAGGIGGVVVLADGLGGDDGGSRGGGGSSGREPGIEVTETTIVVEMPVVTTAPGPQG